MEKNNSFHKQLYNDSMHRIFLKYEESMAFDDFLIKPTYTDISSRSIPSTETEVAGFLMKAPIISSPMDTITESDMAIKMSELGGLGIVHRFMTIDKQISQLNLMKDYENVIGSSVKKVFAVGVGDEEYLRAERLIRAGADGIAIDVANGHSSYMGETIVRIKQINSSVKIIAGNVATGEGYDFLVDCGADAVRVGIGGGSICKTRIQTGCGFSTINSVVEAARARADRSNKSVSIIADGGIRYPSDLVKSLASGADAIMCGRILSATEETPGSDFIDPISGKNVKIYAGMASAEVQNKSRGGLKPNTCAEGVATTIECRGSVEYIVGEFLGGLRSGMTYVNARTISDLRKNSVFVKISNSALLESHAFGTRVS